jgi:hypothetical protein
MVASRRRTRRHAIVAAGSYKPLAPSRDIRATLIVQHINPTAIAAFSPSIFHAFSNNLATPPEIFDPRDQHRHTKPLDPGPTSACIDISLIITTAALPPLIHSKHRQDDAIDSGDAEAHQQGWFALLTSPIQTSLLTAKQELAECSSGEGLPPGMKVTVPDEADVTKWDIQITGQPGTVYVVCLCLCPPSCSRDTPAGVPLR